MSKLNKKELEEIRKFVAFCVVTFFIVLIWVWFGLKVAVSMLFVILILGLLLVIKEINDKIK